MGLTFNLRLTLKIGGVPPTAADALLIRSAQILTRRPALAESLARHLSALGMTVMSDDRDRAAELAGRADVVIADAGSYKDYLRLYADSDNWARPALVIVASAAEAESISRSVSASTIVSKPVHRDALYEALSNAIGERPSVDGKAPPPVTAETLCGGHVLLVEDEPVNAAVAQGYLSALGCTSVWVEEGPEAIARSAAERFDLILMDLSMPVMDGFATTALIRQREGAGRRVPIIALTAHDAVNYRNLCIDAGMDDLLSKPYTLDECAELLRRWIDRKADRPASEATSRTARDALSSVDPAAVASLRNLRSGKQVDLYSQLVDLFRAASAKSMSELQRALATNDFNAAADICHKLGVQCRQRRRAGLREKCSPAVPGVHRGRRAGSAAAAQ